MDANPSTYPSALIQFLFTLPSTVTVNDREFMLKFFINHAGYDGRLINEPINSKIDENWKHPLGLRTTGWLWMIENIGTEQDLREAIIDTRNF